MDDPPCIVYHAGPRSFARIFKEKSLQETKDIIIKKLGLSLDTAVSLARIHGDINLALDDDDDFAAFSIFARSVRNVDIRVTVDTSVRNETVPQVEPRVEIVAEPAPKQQKRPRADSPTDTAVEAVLPKRGRKKKIESAPEQPPEENRTRQTRNVSQASVETVSIPSKTAKGKAKRNADNDASEPAMPAQESFSDALKRLTNMDSINAKLARQRELHKLIMAFRPKPSSEPAASAAASTSGATHAANQEGTTSATALPSSSTAAVPKKTTKKRKPIADSATQAQPVSIAEPNSDPPRKKLKTSTTDPDAPSKTASTAAPKRKVGRPRKSAVDKPSDDTTQNNVDNGIPGL